MKHTAELAKGRWWNYVAKCTCGHTVKASTAEEADEQMEKHIVEADDND